MKISIKKRKIIINAFAIFLLISISFGANDFKYKPGLNRGKIIHNNIIRNYLFYIPRSYNKDMSSPLIFLLHGGGGTAKGMIKLTKNGFNDKAENNKTIIVYPEGFENHWNDLRGEFANYSSHQKNIDDVGFISALIEEFTANFNISKIFAAGISNGGLMSYRLGCELSNKISAISAIAANLPINLKEKCLLHKPISVLIINGTEDSLVPYAGGYITGPFGMKKLGEVISSTDTFKFWGEINKCSKDFKNIDLANNFKDGTGINKKIYENCANHKQVILYTIKGGGHTWPGGLQYLPQFIIGKTSREIDANSLILDFFLNN